MSATVTLAELVASVRRRADMRGSTRYSDAELGLEINRSAKLLYGKVSSAWGERYKFTQTDLTTTADQAYVALPSDFLKLVKVGWVESSGSSPIRLDPMSLEDEWQPDATNWDWNSSVPRYEIRNEQLWLAPTPTAAYTLRCQYVPVLPTIVDGGSPVTFDGVTGWEEWVVLDVAIRLLVEEESDAAALAQLQARTWKDIEDQAPRRDVGNPHTIQRVRGRRLDRGRL